MDKKLVLVHLDSIRYDLEGNLDEVINNLISLRDRHKDDYVDLRVDIDLESDYYNSQRIIAELIGYREESDDEYNKRVYNENLQKKFIEEKEIALAKKLIEKYNLA